jgi:hypothetical protein
MAIRDYFYQKQEYLLKVIKDIFQEIKIKRELSKEDLKDVIYRLNDKESAFLFRYIVSPEFTKQIGQAVISLEEQLNR